LFFPTDNGEFAYFSKYVIPQNESKLKYKRKAVPLCHAGTKGDRKHSSYSMPTLALDGDEWSAS
jgi:hypothetical protein